LEKDELLARYRDKFVVVMREGLAIGVCEGHPAERGLFGENVPSATITVDGDQADVRGHDLMAPKGCGRITTEPVRKGEVLAVRHVAIHSGQLMMNVENVSPHAIERGVGVLRHETFERGSAFIKFRLPSGKDYDTALAVIEGWMKPFDSQEEAAKFGNTATGAFVKEVRLGMTFAEVEAALGLPTTKVDLAGKVLYKYKDMTVEFHGGKVSDVK
jgi:hypothetical protein